MVLSIIIALVTAPGLLGSQEAIRQSQAKEKREEHRARRCNLIASCVKSSMRSREINGRPIVLRDGKLWIDTGTSDGKAFGHQYAGYYLPYPDEKYEGLVTTISEEVPMLNWVYVDVNTYEVKYGVRVDAQPNLTGPWDCTRQDRRMTFDGWEGFVAVEEFPTLWALYFDKDDNGLHGKVSEGTRILEIELARKEKRWKKEVDERQKDQTTMRETDTKEDTPVDKPVIVQPDLSPPGVTGIENVQAAPPEPFALPKTIFPPAPLSPEPQPARPQTPPPAYSAKERAKSPELLSSKAYLASKPSTSQPPPPASVNKTPSPGSSYSQPSPPNERRTTPRLNRNSGTRALAQAQMFEALSQKSNVEMPLRERNSTSGRVSVATSISEYSDRPISTETVMQAYRARPESLEAYALGAVPFTPRQASPQLLQDSRPPLLFDDPADFRPDSSVLGPSPPLFTSVKKQPSQESEAQLPLNDPTLIRPDSSVPPPLAPLPKRQQQPFKTPESIADPAIFGGKISPTGSEERRTKQVSSRGAPKRAWSQRDPSLSDSSSRSLKQPPPPLPSDSRRQIFPRSSSTRTGGLLNPLRPPTAKDGSFSPKERRTNTARDSPRDTVVRRERSNTASSPSRQRQGSASSQASDPSRSSPRPTTRAGTFTSSPQAHKSIAGTTITTGQTNRAMYRRMETSPPPPPPVPNPPRQERSNSSLYREIGNILRPGRGKAAGTSAAGSSGSGSTRENERERTQTSKRSQTNKEEVLGRNGSRDDGGRSGSGGIGDRVKGRPGVFKGRNRNSGEKP